MKGDHLLTDRYTLPKNTGMPQNVGVWHIGTNNSQTYVSGMVADDNKQINSEQPVRQLD